MVRSQQIEVGMFHAYLEHLGSRLDTLEEVTDFAFIIAVHSLHTEHVNEAATFWENIEAKLSALLRLDRFNKEVFVKNDLLADEPVKDWVGELDVKVAPLVAPHLQIVNVVDLMEDVEFLVQLYHHLILSDILRMQ